MRVFVDTSALYALADRRDAHHEEARAIHARVEEEAWAPVTTAYVVSETLTLVSRRLGVPTTSELGRRLLQSDVLHIERPDRALDAAALSLYRRRGDPSLSFVDAVSLHVIRSRRIEKVFAFDRHFEGCGAELLRAQA